MRAPGLNPGAVAGLLATAALIRATTLTDATLPWAVYRCDLIRRGQTVNRDSEQMISRHATAGAAMVAANAAKKADRSHSYTVGGA
jgi:hypothetical protein